MGLTKAQFAVKVAIRSIEDQIEFNDKMMEDPTNYCDTEDLNEFVSETVQETKLLTCAIEYIKEAFKV